MMLSQYQLFRSGQTRLKYKGKIIRTKTIINRVGVCNLCRAVAPFDCKKTDMHHEQYDDNNPEKYTLEVCMRCHRKTMKGRGPNKKYRPIGSRMEKRIEESGVSVKY